MNSNINKIKEKDLNKISNDKKITNKHNSDILNNKVNSNNFSNTTDKKINNNNTIINKKVNTVENKTNNFKQLNNNNSRLTEDELFAQQLQQELYEESLKEFS